MEDDPWFAKGQQKGKLEEQRLFVVNLIKATDFEDRMIAHLAAVEVSFVQQIRAELAQKGKKK